MSGQLIVSKSVRAASFALQWGGGGIAMTAADVFAVYLTASRLFGKTGLVTSLVLAGVASSAANICFHGHFAGKHFQEMCTRGWVSGHHHDEDEAGEEITVAEQGAYYGLTVPLRLLQLFMSFCRMSVEVMTAISFMRMMLDDAQTEMVIEPSDWREMLGMGIAYSLWVLPYDLFITTAEVGERACELMNLKRPKVDYFISFFMNTLALPFKCSQVWRDYIGYFGAISAHTLIHAPVIGELLEQAGCSREDFFKPQFYTLVPLGILVSLFMIFQTTYHFEGEEVFKNHLYAVWGDLSARPPVAKISEALRAFLRFPSTYLAAYCQCLPAWFSRNISLLSIVAIFHGLDAALPVIQGLEVLDVMPDWAEKLLAALVFGSVTSVITFSECAHVRQECDPEEERKQRVPLAHEPHDGSAHAHHHECAHGEHAHHHSHTDQPTHLQPRFSSLSAVMRSASIFFGYAANVEDDSFARLPASAGLSPSRAPMLALA